MQDTLSKRIAAIAPVDKSQEPKGQAHLDDLTKPQGSLGRLEELALRLFCIQARDWKGPGLPRLAADPARIYTIAGDHGVAARGVSLFPQEVTRQMVMNFTQGGAGINVLCATSGIDLKVVDAGCAGGPYPEHPSLIQRKVGPGTADMTEGPAMTADQCAQAVLLGMDLADEAAAEGVRALGTGDMGIGNTTPSTALYCAFLGLKAADVTGPGTGLDADGMGRKARVVETALAANADAVSSGDPLRILAALGGYEIAALAGLVLGAAANGQAVAVDGFISTAAYLAASRIRPHVADYAFLSHASAEPGYAPAVREMGHDPLLHLGFRLGEGTGSALALFLLRASANIFNDMATFSGAGVSNVTS